VRVVSDPRRSAKMKHPSKWPWIARFPAFILVLIPVWFGPILATLYFLSLFGLFRKIGSTAGFVVSGIVLIGWSCFVMKFFVHTRVEPYFNIQSMQNKNHELFEPEPVHSLRDWLRLMFIGRK